MATIIGTVGDDTISAGWISAGVIGGWPGHGAESIFGDAGNDTLDGGPGNDTLDGGTGADRLVGGGGQDVFLVDSIGDVVVERFNAGFDTVYTRLDSLALPANVETLIGTATTGQLLTGNDLPNWLTGDGGADTLVGAEGGDILFGGAGMDLLVGGEDSDSYFVDAPGDIVVEEANEGTDAIETNALFYALPANVEWLRGFGANDQTLVGNNADNLMQGSNGADTVFGGIGNDSLGGGQGVDSLLGGPGDDWYFVENIGDSVLEAPNQGRDQVTTLLDRYLLPAHVEILAGVIAMGQVLEGNTLDNTILGGEWDDTLLGGLGQDSLVGGAGDDSLVGGADDDTYLVDDIGDRVQELAGEGRDRVHTTLATYVLPTHVEVVVGFAETGQALRGNALGNIMSGADGADTLDGNAGNDTMRGGAGDDFYIVSTPGDLVEEAPDQGRDGVETTLARYVLPAHVETLIGVSMSRQELYGNALDNIIVGGFGDNALAGGAGNDSLDGGGGFNRLFGGVGNDSYTVWPSGDQRVVEWRDEGIDTVYAIAPIVVLAANVENLVAYDGDVQFAIIGVPKKAWKLTGNNLDNTITGLDGADTLYGGLGADTLDGGAGDDWLFGGAGSDLYRVNPGDRVVEVMGAGDDTVLATEGTGGFALAPNIEVLVLQGAALEIGVGNAIANTIVGNDRRNLLYGLGGADLLEGGAGDDALWGNGDADTLDGGAGVDVLLGGVGSDLLEGGAGDDRLWGYSDADTLDGGAGTDLLFGEAGSDLLEGGAGDDQLWGNGDADTLDGGAGVDVLFGGTGSDLYLVGTGDVVVEATGAGDDTVIATDGTGVFELRPNIEVLVLQGAALENVIGNAVGNTILGNGRANLIYGFGGADLLEGGAGDDTLWGNADADTLAGGDGADLLYGGPGADVFRIDRVADSSPLAADQIFGFASLGGQAAPEADDRIQLDAIDANVLLDGDQAFEWIGTAAFGALGAASAGELRAFLVSQRELRVEGDVDGDGLADLRVDLVLTPATEAPGAHWFIL